jgi:hypothetical protein
LCRPGGTRRRLGAAALVDALREAYDASALDQITHGNWLRVLERHLAPGLRSADARAARAAQVSVVGLGCNNFGGRIDEEATFAVVDAAIDAGVTFLTRPTSTAAKAGARSSSVARCGRRDRVVLATKWKTDG